MPDSLKGHFLIAGCRLRDPNFFKTAVLIIEHSEDGAMGLVVNRPLSVTVARVLSGQFDLPEKNDLVYMGGPVEPAALFILHDQDGDDSEETSVIPGLYVASCVETFESVVRAAANDEPVQYRVFAGCAGWGAGQLEGELERGDWLLHEAAEDYIFHNDPYSLWDNLVNAVHAAHRLLPQHRADPELN